MIILIPEQKHRQFIQALTEHIIEGYSAERGFTVAYAYVVHKALTHDWRLTLWPTIVTTLIGGHLRCIYRGAKRKNS